MEYWVGSDAIASYQKTGFRAPPFNGVEGGFLQKASRENPLCWEMETDPSKGTRRKRKSP